VQGTAPLRVVTGAPRFNSVQIQTNI